MKRLSLFLALLALPALHAQAARHTPDERQARRETARAKAQEKKSQWQALSPEEKAARTAEAHQKAQAGAEAARSRVQSRPYGSK